MPGMMGGQPGMPGMMNPGMQGNYFFTLNYDFLKICFFGNLFILKIKKFTSICIIFYLVVSTYMALKQLNCTIIIYSVVKSL